MHEPESPGGPGRAPQPAAAEPRPLGVFAGLATLDVVHRVPRVPAPNEKLTSPAVELVAGGPAANAAKTFAALGGRARLLTVLGSAPAVGPIRAELESFGVEVVDVAPGAEGSPPVASVLVSEDTGERAVVNSPGPALAAAPPVGAWLAGASVLLVDGHHPALALAAARAARAAGVEVVVDAGRPKPVWAELLPHADTAICSADFRVGDAAPGAAMADALGELGVHRVAITAGGGPVHWWDAGAAPAASGLIEPVAVRVVDTLGAGDVLHGAYCWQRARGLAFADALAAAMALASARCAQPGLGAWLRGLRA